MISLLNDLKYWQIFKYPNSLRQKSKPQRFKYIFNNWPQTNGHILVLILAFDNFTKHSALLSAVFHWLHWFVRSEKETQDAHLHNRNYWIKKQKSFVLLIVFLLLNENYINKQIEKFISNTKGFTYFSIHK